MPKNIFSFFKKYWVEIVGLITIISLFHTIYYFKVEYPASEFVEKFWKNYNIKGKTGGYSTSRVFGFWVATFVRSKSLFFLLIGSSLIIAHFHYKVLFQRIFVEEGKKGKIFYFFVVLFLYIFIISLILSSVPKKAESIGIHFFVANLWVVFSFLYAVVSYTSASQDRMRELILAKAKAEIGALKAQINPHFLFNTLNNLYGTAIVEDSPKTAEGIQQLAGIMRHAVESSKTEKVEIGKEIRFLRDYIEIQQIRIPKRENIKISTEINWDEKSAQIAPLILMTFAENAFKYGISITQESFLEMKLNVENQQLSFICRNSIVPRTQIEKGTGTGVENTLKRLKLLYLSKHTISINQTDSVYEVFLTINLG